MRDQTGDHERAGHDQTADAGEDGDGSRGGAALLHHDGVARRARLRHHTAAGGTRIAQVALLTVEEEAVALPVPVSAGAVGQQRQQHQETQHAGTDQHVDDDRTTGALFAARVSARSMSPSSTRIAVVGSTKLAVPTWMASAPTAKKSSAASSPSMPP